MAQGHSGTKTHLIEYSEDLGVISQERSRASPCVGCEGFEDPMLSEFTAQAKIISSKWAVNVTSFVPL